MDHFHGGPDGYASYRHWNERSGRGHQRSQLACRPERLEKTFRGGALIEESPLMVIADHTQTEIRRGLLEASILGAFAPGCEKIAGLGGAWGMIPSPRDLRIECASIQRPGACAPGEAHRKGVRRTTTIGACSATHFGVLLTNFGGLCDHSPGPELFRQFSRGLLDQKAAFTALEPKPKIGLCPSTGGPATVQRVIIRQRFD